MDHGFFCIFHAVVNGVDIVFIGSCQSSDHGAVFADGQCNVFHCIKIPFGRCRESGFDVVHIKGFELLGNLDLPGKIQFGSRHLLAVS
jgi:hypothetical protein